MKNQLFPEGEPEVIDISEFEPAFMSMEMPDDKKQMTAYAFDVLIESLKFKPLEEWAGKAWANPVDWLYFRASAKTFELLKLQGITFNWLDADELLEYFCEADRWKSKPFTMIEFPEPPADDEDPTAGDIAEVLGNEYPPIDPGKRRAALIMFDIVRSTMTEFMN